MTASGGALVRWSERSLAVAGPHQQAAPEERRFGLLEPPFAAAHDLRFTYEGRAWCTALQAAIEALQRVEPVIVITGDAGTGKTLLSHELLQHLPARTFVSAVTNPHLAPGDLVEQMLRDFGVLAGGAVVPAGRIDATQHQLVTTLQRFLASLSTIGARAMVIIDDAHHLDPDVLEQLRLLANPGLVGASALQIVLIGRPDLHELLARPEVRQFDEQVSRRIELGPLSSAEVRKYIEHRLLVAYGVAFVAMDARGGVLHLSDPAGEFDFGRVRVTRPAITAVAMLSDGVPRRINMLCERALGIAHQRQRRTIGTRMVLAAARQLEPRGRQMSRTRLRRAAAVLTMCGALVGGSAAWAARRSADVAPPVTTSRLAPSAAASAHVLGPTAAAGVPLFEGAYFEREGRRVSLVLAMTGEPRQVVARERAGGLDIEAGPLSGQPHVALVEPPAGTPLVTHALVEPSSAGAADEHFLRARIAVRGAIAGDVRVEGGRVYIDVSPAQSSRTAAASAPPARPVTDAGRRQQDSVGPVVTRLREMEPFVRSAAHEPAPDVLRALHQTLMGVEESLRGTPPGPGDTHATLLSAVAMARSAVAPDFTGDRVAQARGAFTLVDAVAAGTPAQP